MTNRRGPRPGTPRTRLFRRSVDLALFERVAAGHWPAAERLLPRLSRSANHGLLWLGCAAGMWALGASRSRRAAVRGVASLAVASATVNTVVKRSVRRPRPLLDMVPFERRLTRQPFTSSFPSGHAASAAAFVLGVGLESRRWAAALAPVAAGVVFSRVYTGAHYPSDVAAGAALGAGAAIAVRGLAPSRGQLPPPARSRAYAPALPEGEGLVVVANTGSGAQPRLVDPARRIGEQLPGARVRDHDGTAAPLDKVLEAAAREAAEAHGALGVCGGDGSVNAAVGPALRHGVPLVVFPGGTFNHFAVDLGAEDLDAVCRAVERGEAVRVDVGRLRPVERTRERGRSGEGPAGDPAYFVNTFSLGPYPELVRWRERWSPRIGGPAASTLGLVRVIRAGRPFDVRLNGRRRSLWLLFVGNGAYRSVGLAPVRREDLGSGQLDVRLGRAGPAARLRLLVTGLAGGLARTRLYAAAHTRRLVVSGLPAGTPMAYDGEVAPAPESFVLDSLRETLTVYRPEVG